MPGTAVSPRTGSVHATHSGDALADVTCCEMLRDWDTAGSGAPLRRHSAAVTAL
jgi:hypothetical protein